MRQPHDTESIRSRTKRGSRPDPKHWYCLNEQHVLGPARNVRVSELRFHLAIDHGISVKNARTALELGKLHLLAHALLAHEDLRELMGLNAQKWEYR